MRYPRMLCSDSNFEAVLSADISESRQCCGGTEFESQHLLHPINITPLEYTELALRLMKFPALTYLVAGVSIGKDHRSPRIVFTFD
jgi:hypothetical protein